MVIDMMVSEKQGSGFSRAHNLNSYYLHTQVARFSKVTVSSSISFSVWDVLGTEHFWNSTWL